MVTHRSAKRLCLNIVRTYFSKFVGKMTRETKHESEVRNYIEVVTARNNDTSCIPRTVKFAVLYVTQ